MKTRNRVHNVKTSRREEKINSLLVLLDHTMDQLESLLALEQLKNPNIDKEDPSIENNSYRLAKLTYFDIRNDLKRLGYNPEKLERKEVK